MEDLSRRAFVRNGSAGLLAAGTAGLAGCTSSLPVGDDESQNDEARTWLADPSFADLLDEDQLPDDTEADDIDAELQNREFDYTDANAVFDNEEELLTYWPLQDDTQVRDRAGVSATDLDWQLTQVLTWELSRETESRRSYRGRAATAELQIGVLAGSFDSETVETALEDWADEQFDTDADDEDGLSREDERGDYVLYEATEYGFAVSADRIVQIEADAAVDAGVALEQVLDAHENETGRWTDDGGVQDLLNRAGIAHLSEGELHQPRNYDELLAERVEQQFGVATTDQEELVEYRVEQWFDVATTDLDELLEQVARRRYGVADPDELSRRRRDNLRNDLERRLASIEDDVDRELESLEESIDIESWEEGLRGSVQSLEIDGETTELTEAFLYDSESDADVDALRDHVEVNRDVDDRWATLEDYEIDGTATVVSVTGTVRTRSLLF